jgi:hypothetical protein
MRLLFAISILSFGALLWAALAAARQLRARRRQILHLDLRSPRPPQEVFEAGEFRTPRSLRLIQNVTRSVIVSTTEAQPALPLHADSASLHGEQEQKKKQEQRRRRPSAASPLTTALPVPLPAPPITDRRKSPQSVRPAAEHGTDRALYNRDLGGLTDPPHTQPLRAVTAASGSSLNHS